MLAWLFPTDAPCFNRVVVVTYCPEVKRMVLFRGAMHPALLETHGLHNETPIDAALRMIRAFKIHTRIEPGDGPGKTNVFFRYLTAYVAVPVSMVPSSSFVEHVIVHDAPWSNGEPVAYNDETPSIIVPDGTSVLVPGFEWWREGAFEVLKGLI